MTAYLVLGDGTIYEGQALGARGVTTGEVVFNTGMTGYQEIMSDPSYAGQIVLFTYPLIGNYGVNDEDFESERIQVNGLVIKEACAEPSNWRSATSLPKFMEERGLVGIQGIDTRDLAKHIRSRGVTLGAIGPTIELAQAALNSAPAYDCVNYVQEVSTRAPYAWGHMGREAIDEPAGGYRKRLLALDYGLKYNILRRFAALGVRSLVLPATSSAEEVLAWKPDGILLSPGPGDPARLERVVETVKGLLGHVPLFGICLGNQLLCQAVGGRTYKLKFGHRGSNHPVKDLEDGTVTITSQNHGYAVDPDSLAGTGAKVTQINVNDGTVEGLRIPEARATSIQYHPEAAPGPWDSRKYFSRFVEEMGA